jgi:D-alanyl-D-alanine carboxypeptidase/D-alanyl-D-alanine-endopeptidase (penicillin-binding protein 4)
MRRTAAASRCRAKTGTISFVSALAGYCSTADGHRVAFAFMMSGMNVGAARRVQDRMTVALARVSL